MSQHDSSDDKYLYALAELENLRKRKQREIELARDQAEAAVAQAFLPIVDDFQRALEAFRPVRGRGAKKKVLEGVALIFNRLQSILAQLQIAGFDAEGKAFTAELMEAICEVPSRDLPPGTVVKQLSSGFTRRGKLLRPAQVAVAVSPDHVDQ